MLLASRNPIGGGYLRQIPIVRCCRMFGGIARLARSSRGWKFTSFRQLEYGSSMVSSAYFDGLEARLSSILVSRILVSIRCRKCVDGC